MSAIIMDGKALAEQLRQRVVEGNRMFPRLAIITIGDDTASKVYVEQKKKAAKAWNIDIEHHKFDELAPIDAVETRISLLNDRDDIHGIILQLPVPEGWNSLSLIEAIDPNKDVDGLHPFNQGYLQYGFSPNVACTAHGIMYMLHEYEIPLEGANVVIIGRSNLVGMPLIPLLLKWNTTVTVCHSKTKNLKKHTKNADIIISATGVPRLIKADMVKPGACVVDVGITRKNGKLVGDVDFDNVKEVAGWITPVPGGVGPMTVASLMDNTYEAKLYSKE